MIYPTVIACVNKSGMRVEFFEGRLKVGGESASITPLLFFPPCRRPSPSTDSPPTPTAKGDAEVGLNLPPLYFSPPRRFR